MGIQLLSHWGELLELSPKIHLRINTSLGAKDAMHMGAKSPVKKSKGLFLSRNGRDCPDRNKASGSAVLPSPPVHLCLGTETLTALNF